MTDPTSQIESIIEQAGGKDPVVSRVLGLWQVRFLDGAGRRNARYGLNPHDLLARCDRYLASMKKQTTT